MGPVMPFVLYFALAVLIPLTGGRLKKAIVILLPVIAFINIFFIIPQRNYIFHFSGFEIILFYADRLNLFIAYIFSFITVLISIFTSNIKDNKHFAFLFIYTGSAMGILFSGDFLSLYLFWEIMMVAAVVLISLNRERTALKAAFKYLVMHLAGGGILLAGILLNYHYTGTMEIKALDSGIPSMLILIGIGLNAAFLPVHTWLPDAYSKSPISSALILSVFTTKIAVYTLARIFPGTEALVIMGLSMALFGSVYALLRTDVRQILSYLIISSIGFMLTGIGAGGTEGVNAAMLYAWNHILYNTLLFMCIGAVIHRKGKQDLDALGGLFKNMPITASGLIIGALALAGLPLFNGFVSKAFIYDALYEFQAAYLALKLASFLITLSAIRLVYSVLFRKSLTDVNEAPKHMILPVLLLSLSVIAGGTLPQIFVAPLPYNPGLPVAFTLKGIVETLAIALTAILVFWTTRRILKTKSLRLHDIDHIYEFVMKEAQLFAKDPISVASGWIDFFHSFIYHIRARLYRLNREQNLFAAGKCIENAKQKRTLVSENPATIDVLTISSSLFLTALVVMIFLLFMLFRKI